MPLPLFALRETYMKDQHTPDMTADSVLHICLTGDFTLAKEFYVVLQAGFSIECQIGTSIEHLFYDQLKFNHHLVEKRIHTIFLNGKPVDDIATSMVYDGSTLALSSAMPGLVGATLRRKSPLASFRQSISTLQESRDTEKTSGYIKIKLFNILLEELGPFFLKMGIFIQRTEFAAFTEQLSDSFYDRITQVLMNEKPVQLKSSAPWPSLLERYDCIHVKVLSE